MNDPYAPPQAPLSEEPHRPERDRGDRYALVLTILFWSPFVAIAVAVGAFICMSYLEVRNI